MRTGMARAQDGTTRLRAAAGTTRLRAAAGTARRRAVDMDQTICPACMLPATWPAPSTVPETGITVSRVPYVEPKRTLRGSIRRERDLISPLDEDWNAEK